MSPDNFDNFSQSTNWPEKFDLSADTVRLQGRESEGGDITVFQERNDNQINAKLLVFKLWLLPTIFHFKAYILKFM